MPWLPAFPPRNAPIAPTDELVGSPRQRKRSRRGSGGRVADPLFACARTVRRRPPGHDCRLGAAPPSAAANSAAAAAGRNRVLIGPPSRGSYSVSPENDSIESASNPHTVRTTSAPAPGSLHAWTEAPATRRGAFCRWRDYDKLAPVASFDPVAAGIPAGGLSHVTSTAGRGRSPARGRR